MSEAYRSQAPMVVYLNSNSAEAATSTSNQLQFVFESPLSNHNEDLAYCALQSFQSFNTFASISKAQGNNTCKIINRMYDASTGIYSDLLTQITIPDDHYDSGSLMAYLNTHSQRQVDVTATANFTTNEAGDAAYIFLGLGFNGQNNSQATDIIQGFITDPLDAGKTYIQCGVNALTNAYLKTYNSGQTIATDPYVYAGVYLVDDAETHDFMISIGFANKFATPKVIAAGVYGAGYNFPVNVVPAVPAEVVSPYVINLSGPWMLYMVITQLSNNSRHNDTEMDKLSIVGAIPIEAYYGQYINYQHSNDSTMLLEELNTMTFGVTFYDQNNHLVDFRGGQWTAELAFSFKSSALVNDHTRIEPESTQMRLSSKRRFPENPAVSREYYQTLQGRR